MKNTHTTAWCKEDRPDYKLLESGTRVLTDSELISLIIGETNSLERSRSLLNSSENNLATLSKYNYSELKAQGLTHTKATMLIACFELGQRRNIHNIPDRTTVRSSTDIDNIMRPLLVSLVYEEFWVIMMNRSNKILGKMKVSQGGISGTIIDNRLILKRALELSASSIIAIHNHPSGNREPSEADKRITTKLKESASIMDIQLLDHVIIAEGGYYSFADEGII